MKSGGGGEVGKTSRFPRLLDFPHVPPLQFLFASCNPAIVVTVKPSILKKILKNKANIKKIENQGGGGGTYV